ncbi:Asp-tRNA(Asn)/Glu-tRNA(Gln) amidotransferase subunit GatA [Nanchangia anserum]|uniref:Glutamyl-tRNA(Gln) amidotransferase subunit A n=1 Tax=Nanchangia anserum TaxID=2692125 RepID=A0A8I0GE84_9ACTO|nr:Asp-tRNA(Asn)/Glu-tRNA(Gln) amidotransferase subunit GatA [Nanchangia anserum]MBD3689898.1 Asp-tRNA(Asn)/Glu-tRNA(Gln) amidotransferase subunit GatA [Nanchangia anserum]QOX82067.1 Asp-tRNA(Asn)/Glu-tRNA(Gln) amidotransferase subunit GatA [Nanchangia anserum]
MSVDLTLSALDLAAQLRAGTITSVELTEACFARIDAFDGDVRAFVSLDREGALATAREVDEARTRGADLHPLAGVPIAVKDNMVTRGQDTTCCSRILAGWKPPYDATVIRKLKDAKLPIVGKTNMDEFAMGSSTEHSCYGPTHNPWDLDRIPGGSGGGSAAAVSAFFVPLALGSDTGGSIRQPGAVTGTVGVKPTYGAVSRYGLIAMASSLDQIGPVTRTVADAAALQELIGGHDSFDSTSLDEPVPALGQAVEDADLAGLTLGVVKQASGEGFDPEVTRLFAQTVERLREAGATVEEVDCPSFEYALAAYYLIMPAEVSSNLARFDGIRYGARFEPDEGPVTAETVMAATREKGFGDEVKRRLILGTHVLSAGYYDAYYGSAQKVRTLVQRDLDNAFARVDALVLPTSPTTAFKLGERTDDPMAMYMCDIATIPANLAGIPAMSLPVGCSGEDGLPVGFQVMAPARQDATMYRVAAVVEGVSDDVAGTCPAAAWKEAE